MQLFRKILFASILTLAGSKGFAALTELVISDATVSAQDISNPQDIKIFGGFNGTCPNTPSSSSTCDTCSGRLLGTPFVCNSRAIHSSLLLTVSFKVDSVPTSSRFMARIGDDDVNIAAFSPSGGPVANQTLTIQIDWDDICNVASGGTCGTATSFSKKMILGVSNGNSSTDFSSEVAMTITVRGVPSTPADYAKDESAEPCTADEGFCRYRVFPGDEKVYVSEIAKAAVKPASSTVNWSALRIYYAEAPSTSPSVTDYNNLVIGDMRFKDFAIKDKTSVTSELVGETIEGLVNDVDYLFVAATLDEAGNVQYFFSPARLSAGPNRYVATPQNVIGLLQGEECFIATAAFGSKQAWQVELLREFRDQVLVKSATGESFVKFYYKNSPPLANAIEKRPWAKQIVRAALWPVTLTASLVLDVAEMISGEADEK